MSFAKAWRLPLRRSDHSMAPVVTSRATRTGKKVTTIKGIPDFAFRTSYRSEVMLMRVYQ